MLFAVDPFPAPIKNLSSQGWILQGPIKEQGDTESHVLHRHQLLNTLNQPHINPHCGTASLNPMLGFRPSSHQICAPGCLYRVGIALMCFLSGLPACLEAVPLKLLPVYDQFLQISNATTGVRVWSRHVGSQ